MASSLGVFSGISLNGFPRCKFHNSRHSLGKECPLVNRWQVLLLHSKCGVYGPQEEFPPATLHVPDRSESLKERSFRGGACAQLLPVALLLVNKECFIFVNLRCCLELYLILILNGIF